MLTTAGVTAFATSVNPLAGAGFIVRATGIGVEADGLDAGEEENDWLPQISRALSATPAMAYPLV
jgi:hypothetical protein